MIETKAIILTDDIQNNIDELEKALCEQRTAFLKKQMEKALEDKDWLYILAIALKLYHSDTLKEKSLTSVAFWLKNCSFMDDFISEQAEDI